MSRHGHEQPAHSLGETHLPSVALADAADPGAAPGRRRGVVAGCVALAARIYTDVLWFREVGQEAVFWTTLRWQAARAGGHRLGHDLLRAGQPRDRRAARQRRDRGRTGSSPAVAGAPARPRRVAIAAGTATAEARRAGPGSCSRCGPTAATSACATRCSTATSASSCSRCRSTSNSPRWLLETLVLARSRPPSRPTRSTAVCARRARTCSTLAALAAGGVAWRFRLDQFALALPHAGLGRCRAPPTPTSTCACPLAARLIVLALASAAVCAYAARRPVACWLVLRRAGRRSPGDRDRRQSRAGAVRAHRRRARRRSPASGHTSPPRSPGHARAFALDRIDVRAAPGRRRLSAARHRPARRDAGQRARCGTRGVLRPAINELAGDRRATTASRARRSTATSAASQLMTVAARQLDLRRSAGTRRPGPTPPSPTRTATASSPYGRADATPAATRASPRRDFGSRGPLGLTRAAHLLRRALRDRDPPYVVAQQPPRRGRAARARLDARPTTTTTAVAGSTRRACSGGRRSRSASGTSSCC